jgi:hypothetical protein
MPLPDIDTALDWRGRTVVDRDGEKIGKFDELYLDEETSRPEWAAVTTGLLGRRQTLIPLAEARLVGDQLQVPFAKAQVQDAPSMDPGDELSQEEEASLYAHFGIEYSSAGTVLPEDAETDAGGPQSSNAEERSGGVESERAPGGETGEPERRTPGGDQAGEEAPSGRGGAGGAESQPGKQSAGLRVDTAVRPRERVRLRKYVVTEEITKKVPVSREELRLEREPVDESQPAAAGEGNVSEDEQELVLKEEEPVFGENDRER